jgi:hypothetical protein
MHVGNLRPISNHDVNFWTAYVEGLVHNSSEAPLANVLVTGNWTHPGIGGGSLVESCTTDATGKCMLWTRKIQDNVSKTTYNLSGLTLSGYSYKVSANHDPNGCETPTCNSKTVHR